MKIRNLLMACAAVVMLTPAVASAQTDSVSFQIENNSEQVIVSIFYGQASSSEWSDDILEGVIGEGETVDVTIDDGLEDCMYDFYYTFDDDSHYVERVNMCEIDGETFEFTGG